MTGGRFSRPSFGRGPFSASMGGRFAHLGQASPEQPISLGQFDDWQSLLKDIEGLLEKIPGDDPNWGKYKDELDRCLKILGDGSLVSIGFGVNCLRELYQEVKAYKDKLDAAATRPPPTVIVQPPPKQDVLLPILLAAGAGAAVVYFVS